MKNIPALRTPEDRFDSLVDFPYPPNYVDDLPSYEGLRAHYLDLGPKDARRTFLCLHGEPDWCYLYRKMIPVFLSSGARVIAPDFFGFGRSDKPERDEDYSYSFHRNFLLEFVERLNPGPLTLVGADWGGVIGLTLPLDPTFRSRLERLLVMNTVLPVGERINDAVENFLAYAFSTRDMPVGTLMRSAEPSIDEAAAAAYDAPFPDVTYKAGVRTFPRMLMVRPGMPGIAESQAALRFWREEWTGQTFMAIGAKDDGLAPVMQELQTVVRGCPEPMVLPDAGHFVQESGEPIARAALEAFGDLPPEA